MFYETIDLCSCFTAFLGMAEAADGQTSLDSLSTLMSTSIIYHNTHINSALRTIG
jgi:hypothetical protein